MPDKENSQLVAFHSAEIKELQDDIKELQADVAALKATLQNYHGFVGGVIFIISGLWLFITNAKDIVTWFRGLS